MNERRSKDEWHRLIEAQATSGLSQKAFCAQAGIAVTTFGYWKCKLRTEGDGEAHAGRAPGVSCWTTGSNSRPRPPGWPIELDLGHGLRLRLHRG